MQNTLSLVNKEKVPFGSPFLFVVEMLNNKLSQALSKGLLSDFHFMGQLLLVIRGIEKLKYKLLGTARDPTESLVLIGVVIQATID